MENDTKPRSVRRIPARCAATPEDRILRGRRAPVGSFGWSLRLRRLELALEHLEVRLEQGEALAVRGPHRAADRRDPGRKALLRFFELVPHPWAKRDRDQAITAFEDKLFPPVRLGRHVGG